MKILRILVLFGLVSLLANSQAKAAGTDLSIVPPQTGPYPDLADGYVNVTYSSGSGDFVAQGWTQTYWDPIGNEFDVASSPDDPDYTLNATITGAGVLTGGTLTINGDIGSGEELLLTGSLTPGAAGTAFGYGDGGNEIFQFLFTVTGGAEAGAFGGSGWVDLYGGTWDTSFTSWTSDFSSTSYDGNMDTYKINSVPEPSSILLVLAGVLGMVARRRLSATRA